MNPYEQPELWTAGGGALRPGGLELTRLALARCRLTPGARVLDLGCGPGLTLGFLRGEGLAAVGLERSPRLAAEARRQGPVIEADFHELPLPDLSLEAVFSECALSLAERPETALAECARVLRAGGYLVVSDLVRLAEDSPAAPLGGCPAGAASPEQWRERLGRAGLQVIHHSDHTPALRALAAQVVWHFGSRRALAELWGEGDCAGFAGRDFGYHLFIAQKKCSRPRKGATERSDW